MLFFWFQSFYFQFFLLFKVHIGWLNLFRQHNNERKKNPWELKSTLVKICITILFSSSADTKIRALCLFGKQLENELESDESPMRIGRVGQENEMNEIEEMKTKAECLPFLSVFRLVWNSKLFLFFFWFYFHCSHLYAHTIIIVNRNN